jgi:tetratricopeptide (TPR) repeat protein
MYWKPVWVLLSLLLTACEPTVDAARLPVVPRVDAESFMPAARDQIETLRGRVDRAPLDAEAAAELGIACLAYQQYPAAAAALARAVMIRPERFDWHFFHAEALVRIGHAEEAISAYREALARAPEQSAVRTRLATLHMHRGNLKEAGAQLARVLDDDPGYAPARLQLARLRIRAGQPADAIAGLEDLLETVGPAEDVYYTLAEAHRLSGGTERAAANLELFERHRGRALASGDPLLEGLRAVDATGRRQLNEAQRLLQGGRLDEAAALLDEVAALDPANLTAHAGLISLYGMQGRSDLAEAQFERALAAAGPSAVLYRSLGRARLEAGDLAEADDALSRALSLNPDDAEAYAWLGVLRRRQGRPEHAEAMFEEALGRDPDSRVSHQQLAELRLSAGRHEAAVRHLRRLLSPESGQSPTYWRELGRAYMALSRYDEAVAAFEAGVESAARQGNRREESLNGSALRVARLKAGS